MASDPKFYQDMVTDSSDRKGMLEKCKQLAAYMDDSLTYKTLVAWDIPRMPFNAKVLLEAGVPRGKLVNKYLEVIRREWKDSNFKATSEELTRYAMKMIEEGKFKVQ